MTLVLIASCFQKQQHLLEKKCTTLWIRIKSTHLFQNLLFTNKYTSTAQQYWGKLSKIFHTFCLYLGLSVIMNLIFRTFRLQNFMEPCRDKHYHHTISSTPSQFKIKVNLLIILFHKVSSRKSLPLSGTESEIERMTNFEKFGVQPYSLESAKSTLREKCPNTKFFLVRIFPHSD